MAPVGRSPSTYRKHDMITAEYLRKRLSYDPETGIFRWRIVPSLRVKVGGIAGSLVKSGHVRIRLKGYPYYAHRLVWLYVHGVWPSAEIDHINCDPADNRLKNLREATRAENARNRSMSKANTSGYKGIVACKDKFQVTIKADGKTRYLGRYPSLLAAEVAYGQAAALLHGKFARIR
jgi:hypothetical protein